jgi:hypothetical protein
LFLPGERRPRDKQRQAASLAECRREAADPEILRRIARLRPRSLLLT